MSKLVISPVEWSALKDIDEVQPLNETDTDCLIDIREVLRRHGKQDRFGVALLHSHFPISPDEIMLETSDEEARTLVTKPIKESLATDKKIGTVWMLRDGEILAESWCRKYCKRQPWYEWNSHKSAHARVKG